MNDGVPAPVEAHGRAPLDAGTESSYRRMLKASAVLVGSSAFTAGLGMVRTKVVAFELGPQLFGVMGIYMTIVQMVSGFAALGFGQSAVRQIAAAAGTGDESRVAHTIVAYRRIVLLTGLVGLFLMVGLSRQISWLAFESTAHTWAIAGLGVAVFLGQIQAGQSSLLQGLRRVRSQAAANMTGAVCSTVLGIPVLLWLGPEGVIWFLITIAVSQTAASWWYARQVKIAPVHVTWKSTWEVYQSIFRLGLTFLVNAVGITVCVFLIRMGINRQLGEAAVGLYQSAYMLSAVYVTFLLQSMSGDYYPRLTGLNDHPEQQKKLMNDQTRIGMLLALPGLSAALFLSEFILWALYSAEFVDAVAVLRWQVLGMWFKIVANPISLVQVARGDSRGILLLEVSSMLLHTGLVWAGVHWWGLEGAGIAFAIANAWYLGLVWFLVRGRHALLYDRSSLTLGVLGSVILGVSFALTYFQSALFRGGAGILTVGAVAAFCFAELVRLMPSSRLARTYTSVHNRWSRWKRGEHPHE